MAGMVESKEFADLRPDRSCCGILEQTLSREDDREVEEDQH